MRTALLLLTLVSLLMAGRSRRENRPIGLNSVAVILRVEPAGSGVDTTMITFKNGVTRFGGTTIAAGFRVLEVCKGAWPAASACVVIRRRTWCRYDDEGNNTATKSPIIQRHQQLPRAVEGKSIYLLYRYNGDGELVYMGSASDEERVLIENRR